MSPPLAAALLAACLCAASGAAAQVYRCMDGGKAIFTDKPCSGTGEAVKMQAGAAQAALDFQVVTTHYPVRGANLGSAIRSMRASSPDGFSGWARWKVEYRFAPQPPFASRARS